MFKANRINNHRRIYSMYIMGIGYSSRNQSCVVLALVGSLPGHATYSKNAYLYTLSLCRINLGQCTKPKYLVLSQMTHDLIFLTSKDPILIYTLHSCWHNYASIKVEKPRYSIQRHVLHKHHRALTLKSLIMLWFMPEPHMLFTFQLNPQCLLPIALS